MRGRSRSRSPEASGSSRRPRDVDEEGRRERHEKRRSQSPPDSRRRRRSHSRSRSPRRRRHSRSPSPNRRRHGRSISPRKRKRSRSRSKSHSGSRSSSSDSESDRRKRKHKDRRHKHKHRRSSASQERREKKKTKKEKKKSRGAVTGQWGQYGLIQDSDLYNKEEEFRAWLIEEKMINREALSKDQEKKLFSQFVEDFNTATLPHEKYYNMGKYDAKMNLIRSGQTLPQSSEYDPNADLMAHAASHKKTSVEQDSFLSRDQLENLRKVQNERIQAGKMKVLGLEVKNSMGVRMDGNQFEPGRR